MDIGLLDNIALHFVTLRRQFFGNDIKKLHTDLPPAQGELLMSIEDGPAKVKDVAATMNVSSGAITQLLDQLESIELIERFMNEDDRRVVWVSLSEAGRKRLSKIKKEYAEYFAGKLDALDSDELEFFTACLQKLTADDKPLYE